MNEKEWKKESIDEEKWNRVSMDGEQRVVVDRIGNGGALSSLGFDFGQRVWDLTMNSVLSGKWKERVYLSCV